MIGEQLQLDLFEEHVDGFVHVLLPSMAFACGGCPCGTCGRPSGRWVLGAGSEWDRVTCPECRAPGREALVALARRMQENQA